MSGSFYLEEYFLFWQNCRPKEICSSRIKKKETIYKSINGYQFVIAIKKTLFCDNSFAGASAKLAQESINKIQNKP